MTNKDESAVPIMTPGQANKALASAPVVASPSLPGESMQQNKFIPPRQVLAGGLTAIVAWVLLRAIAHFTGVDLIALAASFGLDQSTLLSWLSGGIGILVASFVPPSQADLIKNLSDEIVHAAQKDPESNVSYVLPPVRPPSGESPVIVPPATKQ